MKKFVVLSVMFGFIAGVSVLYSSPRTECHKKCDKERQSCVAKAQKEKYAAKDGLTKARNKCDADFDSCSAGCKAIK